ncbi:MULTISPECIES: hypothetical protein [Aerococcus]|uniref:DUF4352 domain-containing protein n=1 Tax=Aerococcus sanguinicola TaxID=119206 RepID=A0A5N1GKM2_9LACT|nr:MULTISPECIES: hypothetical protein [Aerococcus]KAA9300759.1 hypothetical protein F6I03_05490 [Aerococcus sanguinicola]MDK6369456.1 hypothetical protein [Aerococcus sp. UMB9870]MDK6680519.1 hypothetical protein [Aerococcus sp. UMB8608]MDK6686681.1 hypothetical protein [Aerococcus sp. UMB8623]MDK6940466.1 hypothetical protein [Aerococcus sp. UMB8487]
MKKSIKYLGLSVLTLSMLAACSNTEEGASQGQSDDQAGGQELVTNSKSDQKEVTEDDVDKIKEQIELSNLKIEESKRNPDDYQVQTAGSLWDTSFTVTNNSDFTVSFPVEFYRTRGVEDEYGEITSEQTNEAGFGQSFEDLETGNILDKGYVAYLEPGESRTYQGYMTTVENEEIHQAVEMGDMFYTNVEDAEDGRVPHVATTDEISYELFKERPDDVVISLKAKNNLDQYIKFANFWFKDKEKSGDSLVGYDVSHLKPNGEATAENVWAVEPENLQSTGYVLYYVDTAKRDENK